MPSVGIYKTEGHREWTSKGPQKHTVTAQASGLNRPALGHAETQSCLSKASGGYQGGLCVPKPGEHLGKLEDPPQPVKLVWKPLHVGGIPALGKGALVGKLFLRDFYSEKQKLFQWNHQISTRHSSFGATTGWGSGQVKG